jgi:DNA repair protein RadA/Sms
VPLIEQRVKEAAKLGFKKIMCPKTAKIKFSPPAGVQVLQAGHLQDIVNMFAK